MLKTKRVTRSFGILEGFLSNKRAKIANSFIEEVHREGRILDVGCGFFPHFLTTTVFKEKYGIDHAINEKGFDRQIISLKRINIEKEKMPFPTNYFNTVVMLAVFEHINPENLPFIIDQIYRVLKKDGVFIMTTPASWSIPILWVFSKVGLISKVEIDDHKNLYSSDKIIKFLINTGFSKNKIKSGFFELFLNIWVTAKK